MNRTAFDNLVTERLDATHPDTDPNQLRLVRPGWAPAATSCRRSARAHVVYQRFIRDHGGEPAAMEPR